jgi:hypothetical protein
MRLIRLFFKKRSARRADAMLALATLRGGGSGIGTADIDSEAMQYGQIGPRSVSKMTRHLFIQAPSRPSCGSYKQRHVLRFACNGRARYRRRAGQFLWRTMAENERALIRISPCNPVLKHARRYLI